MKQGGEDLQAAITRSGRDHGAASSNQKLSRERPAALIKSLAAGHGIAAERVTPEGVGSLAPVAGNDAKPGRARNRHTEMVLG